MGLSEKFRAMGMVKQATAIIVFIVALAGLCKGAYHTFMTVHKAYCNEPVYQYIEPIEQKVEVAQMGLGQLLIQDQIDRQEEKMKGYIRDFGSYQNMPPSVKNEYDKAKEKKDELEKELEENTNLLLK